MNTKQHVHDDQNQVEEQDDLNAAEAQAETSKKELEDLRQEVAEKDAAYRRALADYQNLQRRTREDQERFAKLATATLVAQLLEPLDHLEMAQVHVKDKAIEMVAKRFQQVLGQEGLEEIEVMGKTFDPMTMEVVEAVSGEKDKVLNVKQKGYRLNGIVLRPARVEVGDGRKPESEANSKESADKKEDKHIKTQ